MVKLKSDIEIARAAEMKPIGDVLGKFNIPDDPFSFSPMGPHIAKLNFKYIDKLKEKKSNLILVTAITPTPAGEGKTTTSVGLNDALNKQSIFFQFYLNHRLNQQRLSFFLLLQE